MKRFNLPFCSLLVLLTSVVALESCQPASDAPILVNERLELPETNLEYDRSMPTHISWNGEIPFASPGSWRAPAKEQTRAGAAGRGQRSNATLNPG